MGNTSSSSFDALPGCSKSTVAAITDTETGSHVLAIDGFSKIFLDVGKSINSGTFTVGGHSWHIAFFPNGEIRNDDLYSRKTPTCVSIFVYLNRPSDASTGDVRARFGISLLRQNGKRISGCTTTSQGFYGGKGANREPRWGHENYMVRSMLISRLGSADSFQIRCDVRVVSDTRLETTSSGRSLAVPPPDLHRHLGNLLKTSIGADVTFDVRGEVFAAHRALLAAWSSVFMAEFFSSGNMKETVSSRVQVDDMDPGVFGAMLHFIYTDALPPKTKMEQDDMNTIAMAQHLLVAADKYGLERLKLLCEKTLCAHIELKTVATALSLAEHHGCSSLKEACVKFIMYRGNLKSLMKTSDFEYLRTNCPALVKEFLSMVAS